MTRLMVVSVSWHSTDFLRDLFARLLSLADQPEAIRLLVADNTNGADPDLVTLDFPDLTILPVDVSGEQMSMAHAMGLNALLPHVETPYTLIIDPDVAMLRKGWDSLLYAALVEPERVAVGAPYPPWKLGKYHDFPSPPFAFWKTDALKSLDPDWRPYGRTTRQRLADFVLRQIFWIPRILDRSILRLPRRQFKGGYWMERIVGVVSKDTGWEIADRARRRDWQADLFDVVYTPQSLSGVAPTQRESLRALAQEFELYAWQNQPFITHRNPTFMRLGFNLWTNTNVEIYQNRQNKAAQTARWRELVTLCTESA